MSGSGLEERLRSAVLRSPPLPGHGGTRERFRLLVETARTDVGLAKLAEAHWDAVAILAEAGRVPEPGRVYAVWASEIPGKEIALRPVDDGYVLSGTKPFCSGIGLVDRALLTAGVPTQRLVDVDMKRNEGQIVADLDVWKVRAFRDTHTGAITFEDAVLGTDALVGEPSWYLKRPGFWHGACGPAACWAGGVAGLVDFAMTSKRDDPHTLAHLAAMRAEVWGMLALIDRASDEIDENPSDTHSAQIRALQLRHLIEQIGTDILRRFARAYGPHPLSMNEETARRYQEVELYMRQCHAERDLEALARAIKNDVSSQ